MRKLMSYYKLFKMGILLFCIGSAILSGLLVWISYLEVTSALPYICIPGAFFFAFASSFVFAVVFLKKQKDLRD